MPFDREESRVSDLSGSAEDVDQAINRVLAGERDARRAVEKCRLEARSLVTDARAQARHILERADARIGALHAHCVLTADQAVEALRTETEAIPLQPSVSTEQDGRLDEVLRRLAAELSGAGE